MAKKNGGTKKQSAAKGRGKAKKQDEATGQAQAVGQPGTRQGRVELKGSAKRPLAGGQDVGPADPNQQIEVTVYLRRGGKKGEFPSIEEMGARPPQEREYLTREEFAQRYGAREADIEKVRAFAEEYGLKVVSENRGARQVKLSGTVAAFNEAFGASLRRYSHSRGTYRCRRPESPPYRFLRSQGTGHRPSS